MLFSQSVSDTPTLKISILFTNLAAGKGEGRQGERHNPKLFNQAQ
jgi:hypothetical protein